MRYILRFFFVFLLGLLPLSTFAASGVDLTVGGSNGPISVNVGEAVTFDVVVDCGTGNSTELVYVPGTAQPKKDELKSEVEWSIRNDTDSTIRINKFGVSWKCIDDPDGVCDSWKFDYVKFDLPKGKENKIYDNLEPVDDNNSFALKPLKPFDTDVGNQDPYDKKYLDIPADETVQIKEMEFVEIVDNDEEKIDVPIGTQVEFTVTWGDTDDNTYTQIFSVTW